MFRFTIRDVLWFVAIVGLAITWWVDHRRLEQTIFNRNAPRVWMIPDEGDPRIRIKPGERLVVEMNEHREVNTVRASYFGLSDVVPKDNSTRGTPQWAEFGEQK